MRKLPTRRSISIITNTLSSGGAEKQAALLAKGLSCKYNVYLIILNKNRIDKKYEGIIEGSDITLLKFSSGKIQNIRDLYSFFKNHAVNTSISFLLWANLLNGIVGKICNVNNRICSIRNASLHNIKIPINRIVTNYLSSITVFNNFKGYERYSKKGFKSHKMKVIPNGIELSVMGNKRTINEKTIILSVGRFVTQKDYCTAIKVIKKIKDRIGYKFKYQILGWGRLEDKIKEMIISNDLTDIVELIINPRDISNYYSEADIYLQTSKFEGLSNTVMEAMSFSLPCVVTNVGDNYRLIENNYNGYICAPRNHEEIASCVYKLITNSEMRDKMGSNGYNRIHLDYSMESYISNYIKLIEDLNLSPLQKVEVARFN